MFTTIMAVWLLTMVIGSANRMYAQSDIDTARIEAFYIHADSVCKYPPLVDTLRILKTKVIEGTYVTFIGYKGSPQVRIVAVTAIPLNNLKKQISLLPDFHGPFPYPGNVTSWGYVFDRNQDGKVDYMALLGGAAPYEKGDMPADYPPRKVTLTPDQMEYYVNHCQMIFNHWADDNYDGVIDGVIHIDMDPVRDWVMDQIVVRSTKFDGNFDEVWAFQGSFDNRADTVAYKKNSVPYRPIALPPSQITPDVFNDKTNVLNLINRAARTSGFKIGDFLSGTEEWY